LLATQKQHYLAFQLFQDDLIILKIPITLKNSKACVHHCCRNGLILQKSYSELTSLN